jgi:hypothetical protein
MRGPNGGSSTIGTRLAARGIIQRSDVLAFLFFHSDKHFMSVGDFLYPDGKAATVPLHLFIFVHARYEAMLALLPSV